MSSALPAASQPSVPTEGRFPAIRQSSAAKAPVSPKKRAGEGSSRFYARNGEVFMAGEQGGFCLSHAETRRCLAHWRSTDTDREPWAQRMTEQMADELEAAMHQAERQNERKIAA